ncbi:MAG: hypothetical protein A2017_09345 [Lentisphaerae bacterium GWF2_44_16]|nr:MAG: hypothetical protein A2017_09345 [Lentisphaerae bacterium GWF2_44_16]
MKKIPDIKEKLSLLVEYFSVPAFIVSLSENKVLSSNSLLLRAYGMCLSENTLIELKDIDETPCHLRMLQKEPVAILERCPAEKALFELVLFSASIGIIFETMPQHETDGAGNMRRSARRGTGKPHSFHFSYIHNFSSGNWSYSHPELLFTLDLVNKKDKNLDWRSIIFEEDLPLYDNTIDNVCQHGGNHEIHYRVKSHNGDIINVCDYCSLTQPEGKWPVLVGSIVCAERSYMEIQFAERQALAGRLVGGMIHDFKNLLGGIQNIIEWTISISEKQEVVDALKKTLSYSSQAASLLTGALKVSSGKQETKIEKINIGSIISELENLIRRIIPSSINLKIHVSPDLPPIYGQKSALQDMLLNLCVNARDAMKTRGDLLEIRTYKVSLPDEYGHTQEFIGLDVCDNGCGMSKAEIKSIFEAFYTTKDTGAGLGMWMVREAVQSFDGKIEVRSSPSKGSSIQLLFPVIEFSGYIEEPSQDKDNSIDKITLISKFKLTDPKTVLYIEDDPLIRSGVALWLEAAGFNLLQSGDGLEGWDIFLLNSNTIDLVIQDFVLPGKRGDKLLEDFIKHKPGLPVIVASADSDREQIEKLTKKGAYAFLAKPFRMEELLKLIEELFINKNKTKTKDDK